VGRQEVLTSMSGWLPPGTRPANRPRLSVPSRSTRRRSIYPALLRSRLRLRACFRPDVLDGAENAATLKSGLVAVPQFPGFEVDLQGPGRRAGPARACSWRARLHLHGGTTARIEVCRASTRVMRDGMVITGLHCGDADLLACNGIEDQMQSRAG
jgi:hypothetical protein